MRLYPHATARIVPFPTPGVFSSGGLILHVQAGDGSPYGWFSDPSHGAVSHWWISKTGTVEQYLDADAKSWAQMAGNATYHSVETEGQPSEALTTQQVGSLADLYRWGHATYGWPLALAEKPGDPGFGWHGMGGQAWGGHFGCPGDLRKAQRADVLALITPSPQEDDMEVWRDPTTQRCYLAAWGRLVYIPDGPDLAALEAKHGPHIDLTPAFLHQLPGYVA